VSDILEQIVTRTRADLRHAQTVTPLAVLQDRVAALAPVRDFAAALRQPGQVRIIAEIKRASPSAGVLRADFAPVALAQAYVAHGAAAISVLTDGPFFHGDLAHLTAVRAAVPIPVLRKDFIVADYQLWQARAAGADAVLLIAECLPGQQLAELHAQACAIGLQVLVELHDADQLPRVLASGAPIIGINNRDLRTFAVHIEHTLELRRAIPPDRIVVGESGIRTPADLARLRAAQIDAALVGETLMRAPDVGAALAALLAPALTSSLPPLA
jgi:indole-3-glycerol phosphate synthase